MTDRTHGGTSLEKGHLELMVQRRIRNPLEARSIFERGQFQTGTGTHESSSGTLIQGFDLCDINCVRGPIEGFVNP